MERQRWLVWTMLLVIAAIGLIPGRAFAQNGTARVRIVHAAPDTPPVDVFVDDQRVLTNVAFPSISAYLEVPAGAHTVTLTPSGQDRSAAVLQSAVTVDGGQAYTVAAIGLKDVSAKVYTDNLSPVAAGKARVRFIHASPDAPGADIEVINGPTLFSNIGFGEASEYQEVDAGTYDVRAVVAGANTVFVQLPNTTLRAGTIYDVVAAGRLANIQVKFGEATPVANQAVLGAEGTADDSAAVQNTMPNTGALDQPFWIVVIGLFLISYGVAIRRFAHFFA